CDAMSVNEKKKQEIEDKLHLLLNLFSTKLPQKITEIEHAWQSCVETPSSLECWSKLHRLLHTLAGSSGSFGFAELGLQARTMEKEINALMASGDINLAAARAQLDEHLRYFIQQVMNATK
ncbi:MAG: Hpt domain-containing protein, partial [Burkholderiaceae bacterium]